MRVEPAGCRLRDARGFLVGPVERAEKARDAPAARGLGRARAALAIEAARALGLGGLGALPKRDDLRGVGHGATRRKVSAHTQGLLAQGARLPLIWSHASAKPLR